MLLPAGIEYFFAPLPHTQKNCPESGGGKWENPEDAFEYGQNKSRASQTILTDKPVWRE